MQIRQLRANPAPEEGVRWLMRTLNREGTRLGTQVDRPTGPELLLRWCSAG